jgi:transcription elongation factor GreB
MSKAFLRESDLEEPDGPVRRAPALPADAKNYLTAAGHARLQAELTRLLDTERPALATPAPDPATRAALQAVDQRSRLLRESLRTAVVPPGGGPADVVRFGATVTLREPDGTESRYRLVGADEVEAARSEINWQSPLARALLQARLGQRVTFQGPRRKTEYEIVGIAY